MAGHTPGPWTVVNTWPSSTEDPPEWGSIHGPDGFRVVGPCLGAGVQTLADAHLIAAAPDLLQQAKRAMVAIDSLRRGVAVGVQDVLLELSKAVGRAEGEAVPRG